MQLDIKKSLHNWILRLSSKDLGPACPYALGAWMENKVILTEERDIDLLIPLKDKISVCIVLLVGISYDELSLMCEEYNKKYEEYLFLDTHPEETLTLRGNKTVWEFPAMIIQKKDELLEARAHLKKIGFYKNWDNDLLDSLGVNQEGL